MSNQMNSNMNMTDTHDTIPHAATQGLVAPVLPFARNRERSESAPGILSVSGAESRLIARRPALDVMLQDIYAAFDHAPIYSTPGIQYRSTLLTEDIGQPILWALDFPSLKQVLTHALLLPWDDAPSLPGMYQHLLVPISERVAALIAEVRSISDFTPQLIDQLNDAIPHRRIEWIGTMRDLAHGDSQHARELRLRYFLEIGAMQLEDVFADTPDSVPPIPTAENERFLEFLRGASVHEALNSKS